MIFFAPMRLLALLAALLLFQPAVHLISQLISPTQPPIKAHEPTEMACPRSAILLLASYLQLQVDLHCRLVIIQSYTGFVSTARRSCASLEAEVGCSLVAADRGSIGCSGGSARQSTRHLTACAGERSETRAMATHPQSELAKP